MIWTVIQTGFRRLVHNRVELVMTFIVPIAFFSIFAVIFGRGMGTTPRIKAVVVDEVESATSQAIASEIRESPGIRLMQQDDQVLTRQDAQDLVRGGSVTIAIVLTGTDAEIRADLLADTSDQVAPQVVTALVTRTLMIHAAGSSGMSVMAASAVGPASASGGDADGSDEQSTTWVSDVNAKPAAAMADVQVVDVMKSGKSNPVVSMYAAGIAVMFLLFGAAGAGGAMLEEKENQTLDRLLSTRLSMDQLLLGKWFYQTMLGMVQVSVMFVWAMIVFGVDLWHHLDGFIVMTCVTSAAAAAFGLALATLCRSRGQLNGLSVILILTMSALGGSMVPRYVMSDSLRQAGLWTFNAWALDGFDKVFWRDLPVSTLAPQLVVLLACTFGFLMLARLLAIRWETE
ncbi:ABC transporter permease [Crateriforma conspicua]|uniref:ABC transporter permease n=1 Tax=Crateriforma conspicua TaxID=2527996 RepID=UPI00118C06DE|nr:ABC transporter permease [Crateriforma conspicua]QDV62168.1 ABC-2 family transporter protein [Crateriforma conspicua]